MYLKNKPPRTLTVRCKQPLCCQVFGATHFCFKTGSDDIDNRDFVTPWRKEVEPQGENTIILSVIVFSHFIYLDEKESINLKKINEEHFMSFVRLRYVCHFV